MQTPSLLMNSVSPCDVKRSIFAQQKDLHASRDAYVYVNISVFSTEAYEYSTTAPQLVFCLVYSFTISYTVHCNIRLRKTND